MTGTARSGATDSVFEAAEPGRRGLGGLFRDLAGLAAELVRTEVRLAKVEVSEKLGEAAAGAMLVATGAALLHAGVLFVLGAATLGLMLVLPSWLAALLVGAVVALAGSLVLRVGRRRLRARNLEPARTIETLREDRDWAESQLGR